MDPSREPDELRRRQMMERMKWELARELGVKPPVDGYWGGFPSKVCGQIGGRLRQRLRVLTGEGPSGKNPASPGSSPDPGSSPRQEAGGSSRGAGGSAQGAPNSRHRGSSR
ncbi:alpha/beta-type small acid-soluble spore protein [Kyrpidia tusciae]|uniref:Small acid-soluble spore protein alpha/beta type n=1 Tax=Kyrpidia tusciae (strain DSM 2912 / NBRC 15312 / T2) TaxID=562970 RepID=D5WXA6_KYRT2|nr:alpha/beta-type small acid-soluble spore protein [Kyrpidia tusciae]ADG07887.1 hypothetical protein Btus_3279 [Kyrpidia tusciae DSM 2912]